jgi:uncharacterized protein (UPF0335 family)
MTHTSDGQARPNSGSAALSDGELSAAKELNDIVERIERLEEEKRTIADDIKDVYGEAKGRGYDTKAIKTLVRERKKDENERLEEESVLDTYRSALERLKAGHLPGTSQ